MKKVVIETPSTWVKFTQGMCEGCWAGCCTLPVQVSSEELYHMGFIKADQVNGPLKKIAKRLTEQGIIQQYQPRTRTFVLAQKNGHDCIFLDDRRLCTIYEKRPSICRRFPSYGPRPGYCPNQDKTSLGKAR